MFADYVFARRIALVDDCRVEDCKMLAGLDMRLDVECSSRHTDDTLSGSSTPTSNTLRRVARNDRQASLNPLRDTNSQELRQRQTQEAFALARERQRQRQHEEEERARLHQVAQDAEAQHQEQQLSEAQALEAQQAPQDASRAIANRGRQAREHE